MLRKAVFNKESNARVIAVAGFAELLRYAAAAADPGASSSSGGGAASSSSSSSSQRWQQASAAATPSQDALALQHTVLGLFKRCLGQQYEVRQAVYKALHQVYAEVPGARGPVLQLLSMQLALYKEQGEEQPPLHVSKAVSHGSVARLEEPLAELFTCVHRCLAHAPAAPSSQGAARYADGLNAALQEVTTGLQSTVVMDVMALGDDNIVADPVGLRVAYQGWVHNDPCYAFLK